MQKKLPHNLAKFDVILSHMYLMGIILLYQQLHNCSKTVPINDFNRTLETRTARRICFKIGSTKSFSSIRQGFKDSTIRP